MTDVSLVPTVHISPHPRNPRGDVGDVTDLADSIASVGILQPIGIVPHDDGFWCLMGNRRLAAAKLAGLEAVPTMIWTGLSDDEQMAMMLVENLQRDDLNPVDEAEGYRALAEGGMDQLKIAAKVGKSQPHVSRRLRLLECDDETTEKVRARKLSAAAALRTLEPKRERAKVEPASELPHTVLDVPNGAAIMSADSDGLALTAKWRDSETIEDTLADLYGDAAPIVGEVWNLTRAALAAIADGRLPAAAAAIGDANRRLFNLSGEPLELVDATDPERGVLPFLKSQEPVPLCGRCQERPVIGGDDPTGVLCQVCADSFEQLVAEQPVEEELDEATAVRVGTEQVDRSLMGDDATAEHELATALEAAEREVADANPDEDTLASIHQLRESGSPVGSLGAAIAESMARGDGEAPPAVRVTIGLPDGSFSTRLVECEQHGRITRTPEVEFAQSKAHSHIAEKHGGVGEVVMPADVLA